MTTAFRSRVLIAFLALLALGAGASAFAGWRRDGRSCAVAAEFADSLASNDRRLATVDGVITRFDLTQGALPDTGVWANGPNRLERRVIALRLQAVTGPQLERWLTSDLHLSPGAAAADSSRTAALATIHRFERDTAYVAYLHGTLQLTFDNWHDLTVLAPLAERWAARCSSFQSRMAGELPACAAAIGFLLLALATRRPVKP